MVQERLGEELPLDYPGRLMHACPEARKPQILVPDQEMPPQHHYFSVQTNDPGLNQQQLDFINYVGDVQPLEVSE